MPKNHDSTLSRGQAIRLVAEATRPETIPPGQWGNVRLVLLAIAEHYPTAFPSQVTIAQYVDRSIPSVQRYIRLAVKAGLIERYQQAAWHGQYGSNRYRLRCINRPSRMMLGPAITGDGLTATDTYVSVPALSTEALRASEQKEGTIGAPSGADEENQMPVYDDEPDPAMAPTPEPTRKRTPTPATRVYDHFREAWAAYVSTPEGQYHNEWVLISSVPAFKKRVKDDLIERDGRPVEDVCASIDLFIRALGSRTVTLKRGQEVWKLWWVRRGTFLTDRRVPLRRQEIQAPAEFDQRAYHQQKLDRQRKQ